MKKHIVRAPATDRYLLDVPTKLSELEDDLPTPPSTGVLSSAAGGQTFEAGIPTGIAGTVITDSQSIVTAANPLTITAKEAGWYHALIGIIWDAALAFGDRTYLISQYVNGGLVTLRGEAVRFGGLHSPGHSFLTYLNVGDSMYFTLTSGLTTAASSYNLTIVKVA